MTDSLKTLNGPGGCSVTGKAGGILHDWLTEDSEWPWRVQCYRKGRRNATWLTHWRLWMALEGAVLQERQEEYYMTDSLKTLNGPGGCSVTGKAGGMLHDWLTEDSEWPWKVQCYMKGRRNTTWLTHWRLWMALEGAVLQERQEEYYMTDSLKTLNGPGGCSVTGKAGGILHDWLTEDSEWPWRVQCYRKGRRNTTWLTHWRLWMALEGAVLQERQEEYYMTDSLKTLNGPGGCSVTGKAGGILHDWLTEDSEWPWRVQCYRKGRRNTTWLTHRRLWMALEE